MTFSGEGFTFSTAVVAVGTGSKILTGAGALHGLGVIPSYDGVGVEAAAVGTVVGSWVPIATIGVGAGVGSTVFTKDGGAGVTPAGVGTGVGSAVSTAIVGVGVVVTEVGAGVGFIISTAMAGAGSGQMR